MSSTVKKYFIVADVHGFYNELQKALNEKGWDINNPDHIFISCGDLLDRGPDAVKCLEFVNNLPRERKILIRGNHEDLMEDAMFRGYFKQHDIHNRTYDTCYQIVDNIFNNVLESDEAKRTSLEEYSVPFVPGKKIESCESWMPESDILKYTEGSILWEDYIQCCVDYAEIGDNIFVHGWIPCHLSFCYYKDGSTGKKYEYFPDWKEASPNSWGDARWFNGMEAWSNGVKIEGKTIWCGHWHASWGNANLHNDGVEFLKKVETMYIDPETGNIEPHENHHTFKDEGIVALDACTAHSGFVNCEVIEV